MTKPGLLNLLTYDYTACLPAYLTITLPVCLQMLLFFSSGHSVIQSFRHFVISSFRHFVILAFWHFGILAFWHSGIPHPGTLAFRLSPFAVRTPHFVPSYVTNT